jgi:cell wall-associated NlpC family hydrolase
MENERMHSSAVLYDYAMCMVGLPYRWGGDDTVDGFDCSGLCVDILQAAGVLPKDFDATANGLWHFPAFGKVAAASFGSLAFFGLPAVTHVGFCLNDRLMLEAGGGGSKTLTRDDAEKQNAYVRVRPIKSRKDLAGFKHPTYPWKV